MPKRSTKQGFSLAALFLLVASSALLLSLARGIALQIEHDGWRSGLPVLALIGCALGGAIGVVVGVQAERPVRGGFLGLAAGCLSGAVAGAQLGTRSNFPLVLASSLVLVLFGLVIRITSRRGQQGPVGPPDGPPFDLS